jgi:hypothetical protein
LFDLGERAKIVIFSVTDGEDKPLKYPHMFRAAPIVILNKVDLLPHLDFSLAKAIGNRREMVAWSMNGKPTMSAKNPAEPTLSAAGTMVRFRTMAIARLRWRRARLIIPAYQKPRPAVIVTWRLKFPVRCVQIPCSLAKNSLFC